MLVSRFNSLKPAASIVSFTPVLQLEAVSSLNDVNGKLLYTRAI